MSNCKVIQSYNPYFSLFIHPKAFMINKSYKTLKRNFAKRKKTPKVFLLELQRKIKQIELLDHQYKYCVTVRTTFKSNFYAFCNKDSNPSEKLFAIH
jgi:hypothetical protein